MDPKFKVSNKVKSRPVKRDSIYIRFLDDVWACSECENDCTELYPNTALCPNCKATISTGLPGTRLRSLALAEVK